MSSQNIALPVPALPLLACHFACRSADATICRVYFWPGPINARKMGQLHKNRSTFWLEGESWWVLVQITDCSKHSVQR